MALFLSLREEAASPPTSTTQPRSPRWQLRRWAKTVVSIWCIKNPGIYPDIFFKSNSTSCENSVSVLSKQHDLVANILRWSPNFHPLLICLLSLSCAIPLTSQLANILGRDIVHLTVKAFIRSFFPLFHRKEWSRWKVWKPWKRKE